jgi:hypothetical protein
MHKEHFDQLVKGVRQMKRHMAGKEMPGIRVTEVPEPNLGAIRDGSAVVASAVRKADRRQFADIAELGAAAHEADRAGKGVAQDRGVGPEVGDEGAACVADSDALSLSTTRAQLASP